MELPQSRGPLSSLVLHVLSSDASAAPLCAAASAYRSADPLHDEDLQLSLFVLHELHYRGFEAVSDDREFDPDVVAARNLLGALFEATLRELADGELPAMTTAQEMAQILFALTESSGGPSLSRHIAWKADTQQAREFLVHKSIYQLKEADPHTWAIPRLSGRAKAALVEIQSDEYGGGMERKMHSQLFAQTLRGAGLDDEFGAYIDHLPAVSLASVNAMSLFGLQRRLRGAIVGHLAAYEMTSSLPNGLYARGFTRLGYGPDVVAYFEEHVAADAIHEQIAGRDLAGGLVEAEPGLAADIVFGARAVLALDAAVAAHVLGAWKQGRSSLRAPLPTVAEASA